LREIAYGLTIPSLQTWFELAAWAGGAVLVAFYVYRKRGLDIGESI
jgi:hypothetical protein